MDAKILVVLFIVVNCYSSCGAALRRTPKVYNALITTDENLTSSRAYPVIQPTIHETGIASYPYGPYNPYGLYSNSLLRFPPPLVPGLTPRSQLPYPFQPPGPRFQPPQTQFPQQYPQQYPPPEEHELPPSGPSPSLPPSGPSPELPPTGPPSGPELEPQSQNEVIPPPSAPGLESAPIPIQEPKPQQIQPSEKLPIPLNEYGLPPSLVPLQPFPQRNRQPLPLNFSPYPYQNFPPLYEPYNRFHEHFLPPYDYFPSNSFGIAAPPKATPAPPTQPPPPSKAPIIPPQPTPPPPPATTPAPTPAPTPGPSEPEPAPQVPLESIKNGSPNKNAEVPDVPPPPIPSGANSANKA